MKTFQKTTTQVIKISDVQSVLGKRCGWKCLLLLQQKTYKIIANPETYKKLLWKQEINVYLIKQP